MYLYNIAIKVKSSNFINQFPSFSLRRDGQLTLSKPLDHEESPRYDLVVRVVDRAVVPPAYSEKVFRVEIVDLNDNSPVFAVENPENGKRILVDRFSPEGTVIQRVSN